MWGEYTLFNVFPEKGFVSLGIAARIEENQSFVGMLMGPVASDVKSN